MTHPLANRRTARTCPDEGRAIRALAAAVILRALQDAQLPPSKIRATDQEAAVAFLDGAGSGLADCAAVIGLDAEAISSRWRSAPVRGRG